MLTIVSILPRKRFQVLGIHVPNELKFVFESVQTEDEIISACKGADILFVPPAYPPITARVLEKIPSIRMIQSSGSGYDQIDVEAAARLSIPVANVPNQNTTTVAEFTIALLIALQRQVVLSDTEIKAGHYSRIREQFFESGLKEVRDTQLGLVGFGAIGRQVAKIAGLLGATVSYYDIYRAPEQLEMEFQAKYKIIDELLASSDVISLHLPLTAETKRFIGRKELCRMRAGAFLINTSRGEVVDQNALAEMLESGHIGGAAIDTLSPEPPPPEHSLLNLSEGARKKLLLTPHIAGIATGAFTRLLNSAIANMLRVEAGKAPENVVNGVVIARTCTENRVYTKA